MILSASVNDQSAGCAEIQLRTGGTDDMTAIHLRCIAHPAACTSSSSNCIRLKLRLQMRHDGDELSSFERIAKPNLLFSRTSDIIVL